MHGFFSLESENRLIYAWVWNTPIDVEAIDNKLEEFRETGIEGIYILPYTSRLLPERRWQV